MNTITWNVLTLLNFLDFCRPLKIDNQRDLELFDQDIMCLLNENIHQHFIRILEKTCLSCFNKFDDLQNDFIFFNCSCKMCKFCVINKIKVLTEGKIILNNFEKSNKLYFNYYLKDS